MLDFLQGIGVSLVSLSNNHAWDLGDEGIESTLMQLDSRGRDTDGATASNASERLWYKR